MATHKARGFTKVRVFSLARLETHLLLQFLHIRIVLQLQIPYKFRHMPVHPLEPSAM
jgi:hypothetical protein